MNSSPTDKTMAAGPVFSNGTAAPETARQRRQLAKLTTRIRRWWDALPEPARRPYFSMDAIADGTNTPATKLGASLRSLGWLRVQVRLDGIATAVWVPPGYPSPLRPIGRPRTRTLHADKRGDHPHHPERSPP